MTTKSLVDELSEDREQDEKIIKSFYAKNILSPDIFEKTNGTYKMIDSVRERLISISDKFIDFLGVDFFIHDVVLTGSLANYNWSNFSDVDVHILIDYEESGHNVDLLKEFFDAKRKTWNLSNDIMIKKYEVELYVQDVNEKHISSGVYSILNNKWIIEPQKSKQKIDDRKILEKGEEYAQMIDELIKRKQKGEDVRSEVDDIKNKIKRFRQSGLDKSGEFSYENLTFKLLRRNGYIKKLIELKKETNKISIDEMEFYLEPEKHSLLSHNPNEWHTPSDEEMKLFDDLSNREIYRHPHIKNEYVDLDVSMIDDGTLLLIVNWADRPILKDKLVYGSKIKSWDDLYKAFDTIVDSLNKNRDPERSKRARMNMNESYVPQDFSDRDVLRLEKEAVKYYGATNNLRHGAYITPSGYLLDFSEGSGSRSLDHRNILHILEVLKINLGKYESPEWKNSLSVGMYAVMDMGFIRWMPESYGFDMHRMPTQEQFQVIRSIIRNRDGEVLLEMNEDAYVEYESGTPEDFIIDGIKSYYREGIKPKAYSNVEDEEFF